MVSTGPEHSRTRSRGVAAAASTRQRDNARHEGPVESAELADEAKPAEQVEAEAESDPVDLDASLSSPQLEADRELEVVHGVVLDERTREPVPELEVVLTGDGLEQSLLTDEKGAFQSTELRIPDPLHAVIPELGVFSRGKKLEPGPGPHTILIAIGPTYPLQLSSKEPIPETGWKARLVESRFQREIPNAIQVFEKGLRVLIAGRDDPENWTSDDGLRIDMKDRVWPWVSVRTSSDGSWVRFSQQSFEPDRSYLPRIELQHLEKGLVGSAPVVATVGRQGAVRVPVGILPDHRGCQVVGRVEKPSGLFERMRFGDLPRVILLPSELELNTPTRPPVFDEQAVAIDGTFQFENVPPGRRTLLAYSWGYELERVQIDLQPGVNGLPPIQLQSSTFYPRVRIPLEEVDNRRIPWTSYMSLLRLRAAGPFAQAWLEPIGRAEGHPFEFSYGHIPHAEFTHTSIALDLDPIWFPHSFNLRPVEDNANVPVLKVVPEEQLADYDFEVSTSGGTTSLDSFRVCYDPGGVQYSTHSARNSTRWKFPKSSPLRFTVWAQGFAPYCGTEADFGEVDGQQIARVQLEPGWGAVLHFRAGDPRALDEDSGPLGSWHLVNASSYVGMLAAPPVRGIEVIINEVSAGHSDAEGRLRVAHWKRPSLLELESPGWRISALGRVQYLWRGKEIRADQPNGEGSSFNHNYVVWMVRD